MSRRAIRSDNIYRFPPGLRLRRRRSIVPAIILRMNRKDRIGVWLGFGGGSPRGGGAREAGLSELERGGENLGSICRAA